MDLVTGLDVRAEWEDADDISSPEITATWCRLSVAVDGESVTLVETPSGNTRRFLYVSAYPLAEWIATNWWSLLGEWRVSSAFDATMSWRSIERYSWLRRHNFRAAGGGMGWPDLTIAPSDSVVHLAWQQRRTGSNLRFLGAGHAVVDAVSVRRALSDFVSSVVERLEARGLSTLLQDEWHSIASLEKDEVEFAWASSRLGLDPFRMSHLIGSEIIDASALMHGPLLDEFLTSVPISEIENGVGWVRRAREHVNASARNLVESLGPRRLVTATSSLDRRRPWISGYDAAREYRSSMGMRPTEPVDLGSLVLTSQVAGPTQMTGFVGARGDLVELVVPVEVAERVARFRQGRALGLVALDRTRDDFVIDPSSVPLAAAARAFAAELLAPIDGIRPLLGEQRPESELIELAADRFDVSPLVVQYQLENQLAA